MFPIKTYSSSSLENNDDSSSSAAAAAAVKRKRRPAGTPDPDAEVVSLSPRTLMESDRYVCEICNQGFQRDQNLQMHRRRHKVPWKLLKRDATEAAEAAVRKRVFVCPEPSCLHHDPCHALGDLVGIKKHFRRKHSNQRQWVCDKCGKWYAVQSDYKAHLKTCGTRGHSCDCGRVFSRVESFIEHQDSCTMSRLRPEPNPFPCSSSPSPSDVGTPPPPHPPPPRPIIPPPRPPPSFYSNHHHRNPMMITSPFMSFNPNIIPHYYNNNNNSNSNNNTNNKETQNIDLDLDLQLSVGCSNHDGGRDQRMRAEKAYAEEARKEAKRQIQLAEEEFANAKMIRQHAQAELDRAHCLKEQAVKQMRSSDVVLLNLMTCTGCRQKLTAHQAADENSLVVSYVSSGVTDHGGEVEKRR